MFKLLSENARLNLLEYLQNHESDIAHGKMTLPCCEDCLLRYLKESLKSSA